MKNKNNNTSENLDLVNEYNISKYTIDDLNYVISHTKLTNDGFPLVYPTRTKMNKPILLSFYKAKIKSLDGKLLDEEEATFDITETDEFDINDSNAKTKVKFLSALFSLNRFVDGGVYYHGKYYTRKMTPKFAKSLTKKFMSKFFHIEDGPLLLEYFDKMDGGFLPYWPQHTYDKKKIVKFSAVNATIERAVSGEESKLNNTFSFDIYGDDLFDLSNPDDLMKAETIRSLLDSNLTVKGFYYKGELLPNKLSKSFKAYIEKSFVRHNFTINQRDYLFTNVTKDQKTNYPLYWPLQNNYDKRIAISVVNANVTLLGIDEKYSNFDVYANDNNDLNSEEFQTKLKIIQSLFSQKSAITGALYFDGMLIPSNLTKSEIERRKNIAEKNAKIYIDDNDDFVRINKNFTIEDRFDLLRLTAIYDKYYPNNIDIISKKDITYDRNDNDLICKFDRTNVVSEFGKFELENDFTLELKKTTKFDDIKSNELYTILKGLFTLDLKVRGAIYYKGFNIAQKKKSKGYNELLLELKNYLPKDYYDELISHKNDEFYKYSLDKKSGMLKYWPTVDKNGREVLCSVVESNVHFGNMKRVVKACNNLNFDIYVGETFGLVGESGSGKTTISRAILGIYNLTSGAIYFKGKLISGHLTSHEIKAKKKSIQMIFQDPAASLNERANIDYIVSEGLYNFKLFKSKEERLEKVSRMMRQVGLLPEHLSRYPHEFSGGQRQRIGIARALVIEPELVLADEPISALDVSIRAQVLNLLKKLQNDNDLTYLFIAHDLSIIRYISDRIAVMHNGNIVELGNADTIYKHPIHPYTRALLTAIPQPDPKTKDERKKLVYNKADIDYEKCSWINIGNDHYILATEELANDWKNDIINPKYLYASNEKSEDLKINEDNSKIALEGNN